MIEWDDWYLDELEESYGNEWDYVYVNDEDATIVAFRQSAFKNGLDREDLVEALFNRDSNKDIPKPPNDPHYGSYCAVAYTDYGQEIELGYTPSIIDNDGYKSNAKSSRKHFSY